MSYFTDKEKRMLFAALSREKKCFKELGPDYQELVSTIDGLEYKLMYDKFEKDIEFRCKENFKQSAQMFHKGDMMFEDENGQRYITVYHPEEKEMFAMPYQNSQLPWRPVSDFDLDKINMIGDVKDHDVVMQIEQDNEEEMELD
jgi:hypothetical protein